MFRPDPDLASLSRGSPPTATPAGENLPYSYLYAYPLDVPPGATTMTLPENNKIRILAATVSDEGPSVRPAQALYHMLARPAPLAAR